MKLISRFKVTTRVSASILLAVGLQFASPSGLAGAKKCAEKIAKISSPSFKNQIAQLRQDVDGMADRVTNVAKKYYNSGFSLDSNYCLAASTVFEQFLNAQYPQLKMRRVITRKNMSGIRSWHMYLVSAEPILDGQHLIIDPTIRQFFWPRIDPDKAGLIPQVFIGTESDIKDLFQTYLDKEDLRKYKWAQEYLDTQEYLATQDLVSRVKNDSSTLNLLGTNISEALVKQLRANPQFGVTPIKKEAQIPASILDKPIPISIDWLRKFVEAAARARNGVSEDQARKKLGPGGFEVNRGLLDLLSNFPNEVAFQISNLGPDDQILDLGAGNLVFESQLHSIVNGKINGQDLLGPWNLPGLVDTRTPYAIKIAKKISKIPLDQRPWSMAVTFDPAPGVTDQLPEKISVATGFFADTPVKKLLRGKKKNKIGLDQYGVSSYTETFIEDLEKALLVIDGPLYIYGGPYGNDFLKNEVILKDGTETSLLAYLQSNPTIDVQLSITETLAGAKGTVRISQKQGVKPIFKNRLIVVETDGDTPPVRKFIVQPRAEALENTPELKTRLEAGDFQGAINILKRNPWMKQIFRARIKGSNINSEEATVVNAETALRYAMLFGVDTSDLVISLTLLFQEVGWSLANYRGNDYYKSGPATYAAIILREVLGNSGIGPQTLNQVGTLLKDTSLYDFVVSPRSMEGVQKTFVLLNQTADKLQMRHDQYFRLQQWFLVSQLLSDPRDKRNIIYDSFGRPRPKEKLFVELEKLYGN